MTDDLHLSEETLHHFSRNPELASEQGTRLHLLSCTDCLTKLRNLQQLEECVKDHAEVICSDAQQSLEGSQSNPQLNHQLRPQLKPQLRPQLHELTHQYAMQQSMEERPSPQTSSTNKKKTSPITRLLDALIGQTTPFIAVPTAAVATFLFAFMILTTDDSSKEAIVSFQDSHALVLSQAQRQPGLGFFHQNGKNDRLIAEYAGFNVKADNSGQFIEVSWPTIDKADRYTVELIESSNNMSQIIRQTSTALTVWKIDRSKVQTGQLYRLTLSGSTLDNFAFRHTGGFVLR